MTRGLGVPADLRDAFDGGLERSAGGAAKADHVERSRCFAVSQCPGISGIPGPSGSMSFLVLKKSLIHQKRKDTGLIFHDPNSVSKLGFLETHDSLIKVMLPDSLRFRHPPLHVFHIGPTPFQNCARSRSGSFVVFHH